MDNYDVDKAAVFLDKKCPGWHKKITKEICMTSHNSCILGQIYGNYNAGKNVCKLDDNIGFDWLNAFNHPLSKKEWIKEIEKRNSPSVCEEHGEYFVVTKEVKTVEVENKLSLLDYLNNEYKKAYELQHHYITNLDGVVKYGDKYAVYLPPANTEWSQAILKMVERVRKASENPFNLNLDMYWMHNNIKDEDYYLHLVVSETPDN